ncbi:AsmA family protein [Chelatococcus sp. SYSU_G07232]|uniref:AsmA family protein n=1 Tax=Chelatococcus albus TaxID=3047466 RepID=A0ABT7AGT6_9HYPH|nr:AsmA family protein [Chelatococcus sp. SYSU_G07232]MDJ1158586.1 AsmA family protein [Chelatococcus sp. SYSU_G07232]
MRDLLTALAVLVILVLSAALAVPLFIDWGARRAEVETVLSAAVGLPVEVRGPIRVRFLPAPVIDLGGVSVGEAAGGAGLAAEALRVELAATPLLQGDVRVVEALLTRPRLTVRVSEDGGLGLPLPSGTNGPRPSTVAIERLVVKGGEIGLRMGGEEVGRLGAIDATVQAASLAGPWRIDGRLGERLLHLSTGALDGERRMRLKASLGGEGRPQIDIDGTVSAPVLNDSAGMPAFVGRVALTAPLRAASAEKPALVASATAKIATAGRAAKAESVEVEVGEPGRGVKFTGVGSLTFGEAPGLDLTLGARRIDVEALSEAVGGPGLARAVALLREASGALPLPVSLMLSVGSLAYAGEEITDVELALHDAGSRLAIERLKATLAGTSVTLEGSLGLSGEPDLVSRIGVRSDAPVRFARALARMGAPETLVASLARLPALALQGDVAVSANLLAARNLRLSAGEASVTGMVRYSTPKENGRARLDAQLVADGFDLGALPNFDSARTMLADADLGLVLEARAVRFADLVRGNTGRIKARISTNGEEIAVERIEVTDLGGANVTASGALGRGGGRISGRIEATRTEGLAALLGRFLPAAAGDVLTRAAPAMAPLALDLGVERPAEGGATFTLAGKAGETSVRAGGRLPPEGVAEGPDAVRLSIGLAAADGVTLLRQLGIDALPIRGTGPGRLQLDLAGASRAALPARLLVEVAGGVLRGDGQVRIANADTRAEGRLTLETGDVSLLTQVLARPLPGLAPRMPARLVSQASWGARGLVLDRLEGRVAGQPLGGRVTIDPEGRLDGEVALERLALADLASLIVGPAAPVPSGRLWSTVRFPAAGPPPAEGRLALTARRLALTESIELGDARLVLDLAPDVLTLHDVDGRYGGGTVAGEASLRRSGIQAAIAARLAFTHVEAAQLFGEGARGRLTGHIEFGAAGESPAALVANLSGGGELRIVDGGLPRLDPAAVGRALERLVREDPVRADPGHVREILAPELDKAAWPLDDVVVPLSLAAGSLRFGPAVLASGSAQAQASGQIDLGTLQLDVRGTVVAGVQPKGWSGAVPQYGVTWKGALTAPRRDIDVGALANGLAAVSLVRELERIEAFEADAKERAAQNRRLKAERERREAETRAAEEARRKAEAEARAAEEARRNEEAEALRRAETELRAPEENRRRDQERLRSIIEEEASAPRQSPQRGLALPSLPPPLDIRPVPQGPRNPSAP